MSSTTAFEGMELDSQEAKLIDDLASSNSGNSRRGKIRGMQTETSGTPNDDVSPLFSNAQSIKTLLIKARLRRDPARHRGVRSGAGKVFHMRFKRFVRVSSMSEFGPSRTFDHAAGAVCD